MVSQIGALDAKPWGNLLSFLLSYSTNTHGTEKIGEPHLSGEELI